MWEDRRRLLGGKEKEQDGHAAAPGRALFLDKGRNAWDEWAVPDVMAFRLTAAAAVKQLRPCGRFCTADATRTLQGLALQIPAAIYASTGLRAKWATMLSARPGAASYRGGVRQTQAARFLEDMQEVSEEAHAWHWDQVLCASNSTLMRVRQLDMNGAWEEALAAEEDMIESLNSVDAFQRLALHLNRLAHRYLILLRLEDAEDCASYLLNHESPCVRDMFCSKARRIRKRVERERSRGVCTGTDVRIHQCSGQLHERLGQIRGRPGAETGNFNQWQGDDVYEVMVDSRLHTIPWTCLRRVTVVVQLAVHAIANCLTTVTGTLLSGTGCAQFDVDPVELTNPPRLVLRVAQAMERHASNIACILPDGTLVRSLHGGGAHLRGCEELVACGALGAA